jgi:hypothetical protein
MSFGSTRDHWNAVRVQGVDLASRQRRSLNCMTKPLTKIVQPVPDENQSHKGAGSAPAVPVDTTKGHRDDEKQNIREQGAHGNLTQNTSNRRMG